MVRYPLPQLPCPLHSVLSCAMIEPNTWLVCCVQALVTRVPSVRVYRRHNHGSPGCFSVPVT